MELINFLATATHKAQLRHEKAIKELRKRRFSRRVLNLGCNSKTGIQPLLARVANKLSTPAFWILLCVDGLLKEQSGMVTSILCLKKKNGFIKFILFTFYVKPYEAPFKKSSRGAFLRKNLIA